MLYNLYNISDICIILDDAEIYQSTVKLYEHKHNYFFCIY